MQTIEERMRGTIQANDVQLKSLRGQAVQYLNFEDGKFVPDVRYKTEFGNNQAEQQKLRQRIETTERALNNAVELTKDLKGIDRSNPLKSLQERQRALQSDINTNERDLTIYKKRLEVHGDPAFPEYKQRIKDGEAALKSLRPELARVEKIIHEIERLYHNAAPGVY